MPDPVASGSKNGSTDENVSRFLPKWPMFWAAAGDAPNASTVTASSTIQRTVPREQRKGEVYSPACALTLGGCARLAQRLATSRIDLDPSAIENCPRKSIHRCSILGFVQDHGPFEGRRFHAGGHGSPGSCSNRSCCSQSQVSAWRAVMVSRSRSRNAVASCCAGVGGRSPGGSAC